MMTETQLTEEQKQILAELIEAGHDADDARGWVEEYIVADVAMPAFILTEFIVTDMSSANWVMKKLAECESGEAEIQAMINAELEAVRLKGEKLLKPIKRRKEFFTAAYTAQLEEFARTKVTDKKRSVPTLYGKIGFRRSGGGVCIFEDEEHTVEMAIAAVEAKCPEAIITTKTISKTAVKPILEADPEAFGCHLYIDPKTDTFYVKPEMLSINTGTEEIS